ncbi:hypothetical protein LZ198_14665 [Myxococcus sp. K15C18031901]|uniref:hypothetical protein n=1 Tax=Myxococcus dinghuensis TaxID=2906761 RepID=UPI0020A820D9|nr:hypothetical protein [Myxococcus dinghuensis]MCP3100116.1 hypothetical protein [Myxococcus dinghuensis]
MSAPPSSIFRTGALERFVQGRAQLVLPAFIAPRAQVLLWLTLCTLLACGALAWSAWLPRFESGVAVVVKGPRVQDGVGPDESALLVFLSPDALASLQPGQPLVVEPSSPAAGLRADVLAVEPRVLSPQDARERFGAALLPPRAEAGPSAVLVARLQATPGAPSAEALLGARFPVSVRVGSQRLLELLVPGGAPQRSRAP